METLWKCPVLQVSSEKNTLESQLEFQMRSQHCLKLFSDVSESAVKILARQQLTHLFRFYFFLRIFRKIHFCRKQMSSTLSLALRKKGGCVKKITDTHTWKRTILRVGHRICAGDLLALQAFSQGETPRDAPSLYQASLHWQSCHSDGVSNRIPD